MTPASSLVTMLNWVTAAGKQMPIRDSRTTSSQG